MRLIQISDLHLNEDAKSGDLNCNNSKFLKVLDYISSRGLNADGVIISGDISHLGGFNSYEFFFESLKDINIPYAFLHGNHDLKDNLELISKRYRTYSIESFSDDEWSIISIDSVVEGKDHGFVSESSMSMLKEKIKNSGERKIALFLHHHIIPVGTPLVDSCNLKNSQNLMDVILTENVKFVGTGHAHTLHQRKVNNTLISCCPAVCFQWENGTSLVSAINNTAFNLISLGNEIYVETHFI